MVTHSHPRWDGCRPCAQRQPERLLGYHGDRECLEQMLHEVEVASCSHLKLVVSTEQEIRNVFGVTEKGISSIHWQPNARSSGLCALG